jgi:glucose/arabinose dehydrogenase
MREEIFAYGFRNPWRFSFDSADGRLWLADAGDLVEEINLVEPGADYGWDVMEGVDCYRDEDCDTSEFTLPVATYNHEDEGGCVAVGGQVYRGSAIPELNGWFIYGDYCSGRIWATSTVEPYETVVLMESGLQIAAFTQDADGEILVLAYPHRGQRRVENGQILRLEPAS